MCCWAHSSSLCHIQGIHCSGEAYISASEVGADQLAGENVREETSITAKRFEFRELPAQNTTAHSQNMNSTCGASSALRLTIGQVGVGMAAEWLVLEYKTRLLLRVTHTSM